MNKLGKTKMASDLRNEIREAVRIDYPEDRDWKR